MPRATRPKPIHVEPLRARVVRGPDADGRWYWRGTRGTATVWTGWASSAEASAELARLVVEGVAPASPATRRVVDGRARTVEELLLAWLADREDHAALRSHTLATYRSHVRRLVRNLGSSEIEAFGSLDVARYVAAATREGRATGSLSLDLIVLKSAWTYGRRCGDCRRDLTWPVVRVEPARVDHVPTGGEVAAVLPWVRPWLADVLRVVWATGLRVGELALLCPADVSPHEIRVPLGGKTGVRVVPIGPDTWAVLRPRAAQPGPDGRLWRETYETMRHGSAVSLTVGCRRAGVPRFTLKALRAAMTERLYDNGVDPVVEAKLLGHSVETAMRYYRRSTVEARRRAILAVADLPRGELVELEARHSGASQPSNKRG